MPKVAGDLGRFGRSRWSQVVLVMVVMVSWSLKGSRAVGSALDTLCSVCSAEQ